MKILIVEDNQKLAKNIQEGLKQEGFVADCLDNGEVAEKRVRMNHEEYDLVILDRLLPGKDGVAVCLSWRAQNINIPILMLTALTTVGNKVEGLEAGADDYLAKPFAFEELIARIHALLRRPKTVLPDSLTCGGITIDRVNREVSYQNELIFLTLKEFMMLEYLMCHTNQVITRDMLYAHAWDFADSTFSNTVDVHIKNLRKKINDDGKIIQTIRGVGYKMEA